MLPALKYLLNFSCVAPFISRIAIVRTHTCHSKAQGSLLTIQKCHQYCCLLHSLLCSSKMLRQHDKRKILLLETGANE